MDDTPDVVEPPELTDAQLNLFNTRRIKGTVPPLMGMPGCPNAFAELYLTTDRLHMVSFTPPNRRAWSQQFGPFLTRWPYRSGRYGRVS
eukprot:scaffold3447_cov519-Prasinococcus_capsulatus_cf.AAC.1